jgi:hypothetical protein
MVQIINAYSIDAAEDIAKNNGAWEGCIVHEMDLITEGLTFTE